MTDPQPGAPGRTRFRQTWLISASVPAGAICGLALAAAGLLLARVDLVLLGLPLLAATVWVWLRRPADGEESGVAVTMQARSRARELGYTVAMELPDGTEAVHLWLAPLGTDPREYVVTVRSARALRGTVPILHSGPQEFVRLDFRLLGADASFGSSSEDPVIVSRVISPPFVPAATLPLPWRLRGLTGVHDSVRPGDGGDFRDVHAFTPGDRLRRIDWKATARHAQNPGELYVRRTMATSDALVFLVVDSRDDVGENVADWSANRATDKGRSSMDLAREAAGSLARGYIRVGDRVGFQDLATQSRATPLGGGTRHLQRVLRSIELSTPAGMPLYRQRPPIVQSGALIYVFSTFLDNEAGRMATLWRGSGHRVIAVDVLPLPRLARLTKEALVAFRIVSMERDDRIAGLRAAGIELLRWDELGSPGSRDSQLRTLGRPSRAPR